MAQKRLKDEEVIIRNLSMIRIFGRQGQDPLTIVDFRFPPVDKNILHATRSNMCMLLSLRSKTRDGN